MPGNERGPDRRTEPKPYPPRETRLVQDADPLVDLTSAKNDADDQSDAGKETTCHRAEGWRKEPPAKP
jgi:hypothetical protein